MQKRIFFGSALVLLISLPFPMCFYYKQTVNSVVYVDNLKLFNEFKMTKELKEKGEKELKFKNDQLDSIQFLLKIAPDERTKSLLMQRIIAHKQEVDEFESNFTQSNTDRIWSRMSLYSKEFAELNGYDFIISSDGGRSLLYGKKNKDVTLLLLNFINKKYEGFQ